MQTDIQLYPHEETAAVKILEEIYKKWVGRPNSKSNLMSMGNELVEKFHKIGLVVTYDPNHLDVAPDGVTLVTAPQLVIEGRLADAAPHDHDKHRWEVVHGQGVDGVVGELGPDGNLHEPGSKIGLGH